MMIIINYLLITLLTFVYSENCSDYYTCQIELYDQLLKNSRPSLRPVDKDGKKINVFFGFSLIRLVSVNEEDSLLTIRAHLNQTWNATVLSWNSSAHADVQHFRVPAHLVWTPKLELVNPSTEVNSEANQLINVRSNGLFELSYSTLLTIPCNFDLKNFPFDQQTCTFKIGSSIYDINEVCISRAFDFVIDEPSLMPNSYSFVSHSIDRKTGFFPGFDQSYDQITIEFNIHRRSTYFVHLISWPGLVLSLLTLTIFFLPPTGSERIILGGLLLIGQLILLAIFAFYIPKRLGTTWPWMGRTIFYDIVLTALTIGFSTFVRKISDGQHYSKERPPTKLRSFIFGFLSKLIGYRRLSYATLISTHENDYDISDSAMESLTSVTNESATASDSPTYMISRDISTIKQKLHGFFDENTIHQEWILLAHILNRLCFLIYLFCFSFSIGHHLFL